MWYRITVFLYSTASRVCVKQNIKLPQRQDWRLDVEGHNTRVHRWNQLYASPTRTTTVVKRNPTGTVTSVPFSWLSRRSWRRVHWFILSPNVYVCTSWCLKFLYIFIWLKVVHNYIHENFYCLRVVKKTLSSKNLTL